MTLLVLAVIFLDPPFPPASVSGRADAALVLSGDVDYRRLERAAALYREGRIPVLVLTGTGIGGDSALAMRDFAERKLGVPAEAMLIESVSTTTRENLVGAAGLLREKRVRDVFLVTSASHMGRALRAARRVAPEIRWVPVPVDDVGPPKRIRWTRAKEWFKLGGYWLRGWA